MLFETKLFRIRFLITETSYLLLYSIKFLSNSTKYGSLAYHYSLPIVTKRLICGAIGNQFVSSVVSFTFTDSSSNWKSRSTIHDRF